MKNWLMFLTDKQRKTPNLDLFSQSNLIHWDRINKELLHVWDQVKHVMCLHINKGLLGLL